MKKYAALWAAAVLALLFSASALAADYNITGVTGTLNLPTGSHTLSGTADSLSILCAPGIRLTLNNVTITKGTPALQFSGTGNEIILADTTTNTLSSFMINPAIFVPEGAALTISGTGTLLATGGDLCAAIGGKDSINAGSIHISGGTITATGGTGGAGIGGAQFANAGTVTISGGTVTAYGGPFAGAGIGGGTGTSGGTVSITGGTVTAVGGKTNSSLSTAGAGIGTGSASPAALMAIQISGGTVYAKGGWAGAQDIGNGRFITAPISFTLSGSAAVFLERDDYVTPTMLGTQTHYAPVPFIGNTALGISVPAAWTSAQGAFLPPVPPTPPPTTSPTTPPPIASAPQTGDPMGVPLLYGAAACLALLAAVGITCLHLQRAKARRNRQCPSGFGQYCPSAKAPQATAPIHNGS